MATEDELVGARRAHAQALAEAGASAFPNVFRPGDAERRRREEALALLSDPANKGAPIEGEAVVDRTGRTFSPMTMPISEARQTLADLAQRLDALGRYL